MYVEREVRGVGKRTRLSMLLKESVSKGPVDFGYRWANVIVPCCKGACGPCGGGTVLYPDCAAYTNLHT